MEASPFPLKVVLAVLLAAVIAQAFFGRPPRRRGSPLLIAALAVSGATAWAVGLVGVYLATARAGVAVALGVLALSAARWLAAGGGDGRGDDPPPGEPVPPAGPDWDAFDRARRDWSRPRDPVA